MTKKVIDIIPPKEIEKKETKEILLVKGSQPRFKKPGIKISFPPLKKSLIFTFFLFVFLGILCYFTLSKAEIEIWPETETFTLETKVTVDKEVKETAPAIWVKNSSIPGEIFGKEKTITETFSSSGKFLKEEKAGGIIKVYNAYSASPQVLIATTRFVSAEGKVFRTPEKVSIPGGHYEGGKLIPGEIDIKVVADKAGPDYNIGPSTFSIPGFAGTDRYTKFYAKSFQSMEGGFYAEVPRVTKEDLDKAEETLVKRAKDESEALLKNELESEDSSSKNIFLEESIKTEIIGNFSLAKIGDELEEFNYQVKARSETLLFEEEDLRNFAKEFISLQIPEVKKLYEESLKVNYSADTINLEKGKVSLSLKISAKIYSDINILEIKNNLRGKSLTEARAFLENQPKITKVKVDFWPFWVKKVPQDLDKINFKLIID